MADCVVTGGAGFIGSNLVRGLLQRGHRVTVIDNLSTGKRSNLEAVADDIHFIVADVQDRDKMASLLKGAEWVFHQAALGSVPRSIADPYTSHDSNVNGTLSILLAARDGGAKRVVYASSSSAYGDTVALPKREDMPASPLSPYAVTKYVGELYGGVFHRIYQLPTVSLRYFNVFGPRQDPASQYAAVIPRFITAISKGEPPLIYGDGEQSRDFTFVENVVAANIAAAEAPAERAGGQVFNIGCGERFTLNTLVQEIAAITGKKAEPQYQPSRPGDVRHSLADIQRAREILHYEPTIRLHEGLQKTVEWLSG